MCGNHDDVPKYSGTLVSVNSGDEIAMNSMIISVVSIDGNGLIKVPCSATFRCIVEGKANQSGVSLSVLNDRQLEEMQKVYDVFKTAINTAKENADVIAETYNSFSELLENIKQDVSNYVGGVQDAKKMKKNFAGECY